jgi:hypothetical protein
VHPGGSKIGEKSVKSVTGYSFPDLPVSWAKIGKIGDRLLFPRFTGLVGRRISAVEFVKE